MTKRKKLMLWAGMILSFPAGLYAGTAVIFYAWLSAAEPERWPPERAALWVYGSLALTFALLGLCVYCLVSLIKEANRQYRQEQGSA